MKTYHQQPDEFCVEPVKPAPTKQFHQHPANPVHVPENPFAPLLPGKGRVLPSDLLDRAYRYLRDGGWTQGTMVREAPLTQRKRCLLAAIEAAMRDLGVDMGSPVYNEAQKYVLRVTGSSTIPGWNDRPGRRKEQVLGVLDQAISFAMAAGR